MFGFMFWAVEFTYHKDWTTSNVWNFLILMTVSCSCLWLALFPVSDNCLAWRPVSCMPSTCGVICNLTNLYVPLAMCCRHFNSCMRVFSRRLPPGVAVCRWPKNSVQQSTWLRRKCVYLKKVYWVCGITAQRRVHYRLGRSYNPKISMLILTNWSTYHFSAIRLSNSSLF